MASRLHGNERRRCQICRAVTERHTVLEGLVNDVIGRSDEGPNKSALLVAKTRA